MSVTAQQKRPLWARMLSLEGAMAAFGLYSLVTGLNEGAVLQIFWGGSILAGLCLLVLVRRRDWQKHWAEMEAGAAGRSPSSPVKCADPTREER